MLQWMGGSRRKVTASRKSTQKRQQQFFEQRKRQQQQQEATTVECRTGDPVAYTHQNGKRSLDILSLLNVPKVSESRSLMTDKAPCARSFEAVDTKDHRSSMRSSILVANDVPAADYVESTGTRALLSQQEENVSSKGAWKNSSIAINAESKCCTIDSSIPTSILDIVGDDGPTNSSEGKPVHEAHVAFSVEGLGDLGTETPKQSPQQPARTFCGGKSSLKKAAEKLQFRKNLNSMLDELEMEAECYVQDTEVPTCGNRLDSFLKSEDMLSPLCYTENELSSVKGGKKHGAEQWGMNSLHDDRDTNFWNAGSPFLDDIIDNEKSRLNWKNEDANILRNVPPGFGLEESQLLPRSHKGISVRYNDLDEGDRHFCSLEEPNKYSSFMCDYKPQATHLSPYMDMEDRRDNFTSLSEDSCSSSAVKGRNVAGMPSERHTRRYNEDLPWQLNSNGKGNFQEEVEDILAGTKRGDDCDRSRKYRRSNAGHIKSAYISRTTVNENYCLEDSWLFEEEFPLGNTDTNPDPFISTSWRNRHRGRGGDPFNTNVQADLLNSSHCQFGMFDNNTRGELSPENVEFSQPFDSKQSFNTSFPVGGTCRESSRGVYHNINIPHQSSTSEDVVDFFGDTEAVFPVPELSAQGSVTEEVGDKPESNPEKITKISRQNVNTSQVSKSTAEETNIKENGSSNCKERNDIHQVMVTNTSEEDAEETSLSVRIQHESEDESNTKELHRSIPGLSQRNLKVSVGDVGTSGAKPVNDENLKRFEAKTRPIQPSCQVMTVERYVFQLFCVSQGTSAMWDTTSRLS
ncbi:hypothetical protein RND81_05G227300 [Saponaria officinalis]|uniref:Uncharacterized protein n=1 Tax=Saponaria officinalis TaxID=3572 RepID=A0AAW1L370_SAPOF